MTKMPYKVVVQGRSGRETRYFETRKEFDKFYRENERWVTSYGVPERDPRP